MNINVLGDRKRVRYDEGLIDVVNKRFEKETDLPAPEEPDFIEIPSEAIIEDLDVVFDYGFSAHSLGKDDATQDQWLNKFSATDTVMASMPDLYKLAKQLKSKEQNMVYEGLTSYYLLSEQIRQNLVTDIFKRRLVTSTRIQHVKDRLFKIIHHYKCKDFVVEKGPLVIPKKYYTGLVIEEYFKKPEGLEFARALFDTKDSYYEIISNLRYLLKDEQVNPANTVIIYTPDEDDLSDKIRKEFPCFIYKDKSVGDRSRIIMGTSESLNLEGSTRGVRYTCKS